MIRWRCSLAWFVVVRCRRGFHAAQLLERLAAGARLIEDRKDPPPGWIRLSTLPFRATAGGILEMPPMRDFV